MGALLLFTRRQGVFLHPKVRSIFGNQPWMRRRHSAPEDSRAQRSEADGGPPLQLVPDAPKVRSRTWQAAKGALWT